MAKTQSLRVSDKSPPRAFNMRNAATALSHLFLIYSHESLYSQCDFALGCTCTAAERLMTSIAPRGAAPRLSKPVLM